MEIDEIAAVYELGFIIGYFSTEDLISWSDNNINKYKDLNDYFIELSLSKDSNKSDILRTLRKTNNGVSKESYNVILGLIARDYFRNKLNINIVAEFLNKMNIFVEDFHWTDILSNASSEAEIESIKKKLDVFLTTYKNSANSFPTKA